MFKLFRPSLLRRLFTGYVIIILILTISISFLISRQIRENNLKNIESSLLVEANFLSQLSRSTLQDPSKQAQLKINKIITELGEKTDSRLTLIAVNGKVLADSNEPPANMDNHLQRSEIEAAINDQILMPIRFSQTLQKEMIYFALKIMDKEKILGFARISIPLTLIDEQLNQSYIAISLSAIISALIALFFGFYFVKRFSTPLINLTEVANSISKGDYKKRIVTDQTDEIGLLAKSFNKMAENYETQLNETESERNRLSMIFTGMVEGVIYVNEKEEILHINQAALNMFDLSKSSCIKQPLSNQIKGKEIILSVKKALAQKDIVKNQMRREDLNKNPEMPEVIDIYVAALNNEMGTSIGAVIVLNNISELAYLERVRRDFVANASHELKTPITAIRGLTETIIDDELMPKAIRNNFMEKIKLQTIRLSSLVGDLMSISRLESNQNGSVFEPIDLTNTLRLAIKNATALCVEKKIEVSNNLIDEKIMIAGDRQEINQLIDNLIDNAIKYTPSHGSILITLSIKDKSAEILIKDTGIGISLQDQKRIFERFYRVDKARTNELGGTGLGLSIVKNIVEKHNGTIDVESRIDHGSTFKLHLPIL